MRGILSLIFSILPIALACARTIPEAAPCLAAVAAVERGSQLPPRLLNAIGLVESGRVDPVRKTVAPWPWTINVAGVGYFYETEGQAIAAVQTFQAAGVQSIDVGCMQINLFHHPHAFRSLDEAFDPLTNTAYAARFLTSLFRETNSWPAAAAAYHSRTPDLAAGYAQRVMAIWPLAGRYGGLTFAAAAKSPVIRIDPYGVATPQFAAQLRQDAMFRSARDAAMRGLDLPGTRRTFIVYPRPHARLARLGAAE